MLKQGLWAGCTSNILYIVQRLIVSSYHELLLNTIMDQNWIINHQLFISITFTLILNHYCEPSTAINHHDQPPRAGDPSRWSHTATSSRPAGGPTGSLEALIPEAVIVFVGKHKKNVGKHGKPMEIWKVTCCMASNRSLQNNVISDLAFGKTPAVATGLRRMLAPQVRQPKSADAHFHVQWIHRFVAWPWLSLGKVKGTFQDLKTGTEMQASNSPLAINAGT